jgi:AraC family transcriptional regulator, glycine betaine-responsive activator
MPAKPCSIAEWQTDGDAHGPAEHARGQRRAHPPRRFVFVLLDNFTLLSFASALESAADRQPDGGSAAYSWMLIGEGGDSVSCSAGTRFKLDAI